MKKLLRIGLCALSAVIMQACATMSLSELRPVGQIETKLPALTPDIDVYSIESAYSLYKTSSDSDVKVSVSASVGASNDDSQVQTQPYYYYDSSSSYVRRRDQRVQDAITIFSREITENISSPTGRTQGTAYCRIAAGNVKTTGWGLTLLSSFLLLTPNLFGLPLKFYITELDVDCDIYNLQGDCVGHYNAYGKSRRIPVALYYGYDSNNAERKSAAGALKDAMNKIKAQIEGDSQRLIRELQ